MAVGHGSCGHGSTVWRVM